MARDEQIHLGSSEHVQQLLAPLTACVNTDTLLQLAHGFAVQYRHLASESTEHFLATQVVALPTGDEKGAFVAIDLGGTNLRVEFVELLGDADLADTNTTKVVNGSHPSTPTKVRRSSQKAWPIEAHLKYDAAEDLFAWIGDCIAEVLRVAIEDGHCKASSEAEIPIGVTFSFPMTQTSLSEATLMPMGKGFAITSDLNLGKMLLAGYARHCSTIKTDTDGNGNGNGNGHSEDGEAPSPKRRKLTTLPKIRIAAITNDTVATYVSSAYTIKSQADSRTTMGLIVGTGCNATVPMWLADLHPEKQAFVTLLPGQEAHDTKIVVNTEWTIRGTDVPMRKLDIITEWDDLLGSQTEAPGFQPFEYMTGGRYLGELVRLILIDLLEKTSDDGVKVPTGLLKKDSISTAFIATKVTGSEEKDLCEELESKFPAPLGTSKPYWTGERAHLVQKTTEAVQVRASVLIAAAVVGLLACVRELKLDVPDVDGEAKTNGVNGHRSPASDEIEDLVVAYTGSLIEKYPGYLDACQQWIDDLVKHGSKENGSKRVVLREATDGGVIGAAVLAGVALSRGG